MRSSLRKLRGLGLERSELREKRDHRTRAKQDELVQAAQNMQDIKGCYDGLLSAAAATANSAYEFSEALREMGTCLLEKTALHDDEDSDQALLMLGKAQFELQKFVDNYRAHIIETITTPSECLLGELQIVEEMKQQCDDKRDLYKFMLTAPREKGKSRNSKREMFTLHQLQVAQEDYEEAANLFIFRLKSLKQGQSRSLLTQAARHHAAQLNFFRKGVKSLELIEPHIKAVTEQQHIHYHFRGLEDDFKDFGDDDGSSSYSSSDGELSFDYGLNEQAYNTLATNSVEENVSKNQAEPPFRNQRPNIGSQSAPISTYRKIDSSDKANETAPSSTRKYHTYALPTPVEVKNSASTGTSTSFSSGCPKSNIGFPTVQMHKSSLESHKLVDVKDKNLPSPTRSPNALSVLKESIMNTDPTKTSASSKGLAPNINSFSAPEASQIKWQAFSGPLIGTSMSNKAFSASFGISKLDDPAGHSQVSHISVSPLLSTNTLAPLSSLKNGSVHELPRPPVSLTQLVGPITIIGHSAPLVSGGQEILISSKFSQVTSQKAAPLPAPPDFVPRSFSIPYRGQRTPFEMINKLLEAPHNLHWTEEVDSPPLTPVSLESLLHLHLR